MYKDKTGRVDRSTVESFKLSNNLSSAASPSLRTHMGKYEKGI